MDTDDADLLEKADDEVSSFKFLFEFQAPPPKQVFRRTLCKGPLYSKNRISYVFRRFLFPMMSKMEYFSGEEFNLF